jgi:hypothetical protein
MRNMSRAKVYFFKNIDSDEVMDIFSEIGSQGNNTSPLQVIKLTGKRHLESPL